MAALRRPPPRSTRWRSIGAAMTEFLAAPAGATRGDGYVAQVRRSTNESVLRSVLGRLDCRDPAAFDAVAARHEVRVTTFREAFAACARGRRDWLAFDLLALQECHPAFRALMLPLWVCELQDAALEAAYHAAGEMAPMDLTFPPPDDPPLATLPAAEVPARPAPAPRKMRRLRAGEDQGLTREEAGALFGRLEDALADLLARGVIDRAERDRRRRAVRGAAKASALARCGACRAVVGVGPYDCTACGATVHLVTDADGAPVNVAMRRLRGGLYRRLFAELQADVLRLEGTTRGAPARKVKPNREPLEDVGDAFDRMFCEGADSDDGIQAPDDPPRSTAKERAGERWGTRRGRGAGAEFTF